jgi:hypothetical protein
MNRRLSIEPLEDRTTPATFSQFRAAAFKTYMTTTVLQEVMTNFKEYAWILLPQAKPYADSFFTGIYKQAKTTLDMASEFSGTGTASLIRPFASANASFAKTVGNMLNFDVTDTVISPPASNPPNPTPPAPDAGMTNTMPSATSTSFINQGNGLKIWDVRTGTGEAVTAGASVTVFYTGWLASNGTKFDSKRSPASPATFSLNQVIDGWKQGIVGMKDGGIRRLYIPAALAYGAAGSGSNVPPNADLIFEVKLVSHSNPATPPNLAQSTVAVNPVSVASGSTSTVTFTARNAAGTALTTGGATVAFTLGTGTGQGTFGPVTDNNNGTYTATFTGTTVGTNTISATVGGQALTSTPAAITITTATGPGPVDPAQTTVAAAPTSVAVGATSTITLTARDAGGTQLTAGGSAVVFTLGTGTATGTFGTVSDNGNGTYSATFIGTAAGTNTIAATIDGVAITSTAPTITVTTASAATADPATSTVATATNSTAVGDTNTITLTARDAAGTQLATGGATVLFSLGTGTGQGTFGTVTDNGNGTYSATFTATTAGTNTIGATINGVPVTSTAPSIIVTTPAASTTADPAMSTIEADIDTLVVGEEATLTVTAIDAAGNPLTEGGSTVAFTLGTGTAAGTFGTVTDNDNGTYTATFTATTAGTNTIGATIGGVAITSTPPTITVAAAPTADPAMSTIETDLDALAVGEAATITVTAIDADGVPLSNGGATVAFTLGTGTAAGTFGTVTDNQDGTYTATFTATTAGTNTIGATIGGVAITSEGPTITVTAAGTLTADPSQTTIEIAPATVQVGQPAVVTVTAVAADGTPLTTGGSTVVIALGTGTGTGIATGSITAVSDNGNGTYTATFTPTSQGTNSITAMIDGDTITSGDAAVTVT